LLSTFSPGFAPKEKGIPLLVFFSSLPSACPAAGAGGVGRVAGEIPRKFRSGGCASSSSASAASTKGFGSNARFPTADAAPPKEGMAPPEKKGAFFASFFFGVLKCPNGYGLILDLGAGAGAANFTLDFASTSAPLSLVSSSTNSSKSSSSAGSTAGEAASPSAGGDGFSSAGCRPFLLPDDIAICAERYTYASTVGWRKDMRGFKMEAYYK